jgi:hypothetical protein
VIAFSGRDDGLMDGWMDDDALFSGWGVSGCIGKEGHIYSISGLVVERFDLH